MQSPQPHLHSAAEGGLRSMEKAAVDQGRFSHNCAAQKGILCGNWPYCALKATMLISDMAIGQKKKVSL